MKVYTLVGQALLLTVCAAVVLAEDKPGDKKKQFQEYIEKFGPPGPEHKMLEPLIGTWQGKVKCWMDPSEPPQVSDSTLVRKWILDGRFVQEDVDGKMMDRPFQGRGTLGYDRAKRKYCYLWIDSVSTAMQLSHGIYDEANKTWTFRHEDTCPITNQPVKMRDTLRIVSADEQQLEMFRQLGEEKEHKAMEIVLTRQK